MSEKDFLSQFSSDGKKPDSFKEEERIKVDKPKKQINPKGFIIGGVIVVILGVLSYFLFFAPKIEMPNFVGQTKSDVASWVKQQGITTSGIVFKEEYNFDNDENVILSQSVDAGKKVKNDVKITFTISLGADPDEKISVPNINSMSKSEIENWISTNKLTKTKITTTYNESVDKDSVISYEIKGVDEADFTRSSTMNITISKGPQPAGTVTVSDFKDKMYEEVESWAKTNKVTLNKIEAYSDKVDSGKVISQSVSANSTMKTTDTLTITVSKGKGIAVPNLSNMNEEQINAWIKKNNINATITSEYSTSDKRVLSSNVSSGTMISSSDDVQIVLNKGNFFYWDEEGKDIGTSIVGTKLNKLEDWCNEKRHIGIDAYVGNWSESSEVYSDKYEKGEIVSVEISSYSTAEKFNISDRLPLDVRFSVVISKGRYYSLEDNFSDNASSGDVTTVSDLIDYLASRKITYTLADNIGSGDYGCQAKISGLNVDSDIYDDKQYVIEKAEGNVWYKKADTKSTNETDTTDTTGGEN